MEIKIGCDPELFIINPRSGEFVSAHKMVPGTKYKPHKVKNGAVQHDGTAAEFNIEPALSADEWVNNIASVRKQLQDMVPGYNLVAEPTATFTTEYWKAIPHTAKTLGCDPDFNAWGYSQNEPPNPGLEPMRTGAGHVHIGWTSDMDVYDADHFMLCAAVARQMDYYLGIHSLLWDKDPTRRNLYGKAGAFRPKPYGMEYRVLSNAWLNSPILTRWVYNATKQGAEDFFRGFRPEDFFGDAAQDIIDNNELDWMLKYPGIDIDVPVLPKSYYPKAS